MSDRNLPGNFVAFLLIGLGIALWLAHLVMYH